MKMNYVFDIDGTISFNGIEISPEIVAALRRLECNGHNLIFASARPIRDLRPIIPEFADNHLLIGGNGSIVQNNLNEIEAENFIENVAFNMIKKIITTHKLHYVIDDVWHYSANIVPYHKIYQQLDPAKLANNVAIPAINKPIKIILVDISTEKYSSILKQLQQIKELSIIEHTGENSIDITALGINKYSTLQKYIAESYIAFGNDSNDFELLSNASRSVWVGGNNDRLRQLDFVPDVICQAVNVELSKVIDDINL